MINIVIYILTYQVTGDGLSLTVLYRGCDRLPFPSLIKADHGVATLLVGGLNVSNICPQYPLYHVDIKRRIPIM